MKGYPTSDPGAKRWSSDYKYHGYPRWVPSHCPRCGEHTHDVPFGRPNQGMCPDCRAISHVLSQRKYQESL